MNKNNTQAKLEQTNRDLEECLKRYSLDNEDKNRRINALHQELKELQDRINDTGAKNLFLSGKNNEVGNNLDKTHHEQSDVINRLKIEHDKLVGENNELHNRLAYLTREVDVAKSNLERNSYDNAQSKNAMDHQLAQLNENIRETNLVNNNLDGDLKLAFRNKYEFDQKSKDDKNELEHKIRETKYTLERAETEHYSLKQRLEETESKYAQV